MFETYFLTSTYTIQNITLSIIIFHKNIFIFTLKQFSNENLFPLASQGENNETLLWHFFDLLSAVNFIELWEIMIQNLNFK